MQINDFTAPDRILCQHEISSKKRALETMSQLMAMGKTDYSATQIFMKLLEREKLGSTGLGNGVALPHSRVTGIEQPIIAIATLANPIDYDAIDGKPVDIIFGLIVPEDCTEGHLKILAQAAKMFKESSFCDLLRKASNTQNLFNLVSRGELKNATV